ncbi:LexA family transcriptional regulator [Roseivivax isoporae]|nr:S24 family peptidase [Roseivivax isoporae]
MEEMHERLRRARLDAGIASAHEAAERLGVKYPTYAGHENGSRSFGRDAAQRYARVFGVAVEWLLFGSGEVKRVENGDPAPDESALVPVYNVEASAGGGAVVEAEEQAYSLAFPPFYLRKITGGSVNDLAVIGVKGDSMEPTLPDDSIVLVDQSKRNLGYDGLFVLQIDGVLHVKRVGRGTRSGHILIISDNKDVHPAFERAIDEVHAVGKVLWYGRKV